MLKTKSDQCHICSKQFSRSEHLTRHLLIHSGEKAYPCFCCDKKFSRLDQLQRHERTCPLVAIAVSKGKYSRIPSSRKKGISLGLIKSDISSKNKMDEKGSSRISVRNLLNWLIIKLLIKLINTIFTLERHFKETK